MTPEPQTPDRPKEAPPVAYTPHRPNHTESSDQLRARIPGWGVDLDPADRPSVPKLQYQEDLTGAHWEFPDRQPETFPRERSIEHAFLTPVFGTTCPPKGLSGVVRRLSYRRYSEARAAHWLLLILADRIDAVEHHLASLVSLRPDQPVTQTGVVAEFRRNGVRSRTAGHRADRHHVLDPVVVVGPWVAAGAVGIGAARALRGRRRRRSTALRRRSWLR